MRRYFKKAIRPIIRVFLDQDFSGDIREDRRHRNRPDQRSVFERDRDRILYTDAFNRLSGVTQVARTGESYIYHDRLSHSLKVAQVGRRLTEYLLRSTNDDLLKQSVAPNPDVVESAALAHDLGHPPFGHTVEKQLDECVTNEKIDEGFEANAQSFRIVTKLSNHREEYPGLDLSRATLNAILKYPWKRGENNDKPDKWGYYQTEQEDFEFARKQFPNQKQSVEAQLMDWADDVAYAVHDLDDFYRAGLLPLDRILEESEERSAFIDHVHNNTNIPSRRFDPVFLLESLSDFAVPVLKKPYKADPHQESEMNILTSFLIDRYLGFPGRSEENLIYLSKGSYGLNLEIDSMLQKEVKTLIELTKYYIINNSALMAQQHGQRKIVKELFHTLMNQAVPEASYRGIIPSPYKDRINKSGNNSKKERVRIIIDFITSLTEQQTIELYERLEGTSPGSLQDRIVR